MLFGTRFTAVRFSEHSEATLDVVFGIPNYWVVGLGLLCKLLYYADTSVGFIFYCVACVAIFSMLLFVLRHLGMYCITIKSIA